MKIQRNPRTLVAMSGGVDSSVAAALMLEVGHECAGITMQLHAQESSDTSAVEDAKQVCALLNIPHYTVDVSDEFSHKVIGPFVQGYTAGYTPNPCILCNRHLKFGRLLSWAQERGFDYVATGHYARVEGRRLLKAQDLKKDQSYVLYSLTGEQLEHIRFPLGAYTKDEVRSLAAERGFANAHRAESQDICFIPGGDYVGFIESYMHKEQAEHVPKPGTIVTTDGTVVGTHGGVHRYTIGQRRGLGIPGPEPYYVLDIDAAEARVVIGTDAERGRYSALLAEFNVINPGTIENGQHVIAKHRYQGREHQAQVFLQSDNTAKIAFAKKQSDLTQGQALVVYDGDCVLGGGTIVATQ